jgi:hypothetical protein
VIRILIETHAKRVDQMEDSPIVKIKIEGDKKEV